MFDINCDKLHYSKFNFKRYYVSYKYMMRDEVLAKELGLTLEQYVNLLINEFNGYINDEHDVYFNTKEDCQGACDYLNVLANLSIPQKQKYQEGY